MNLPRIGQPAPPFKAKAVFDGKIVDVAFSNYEKKYLVLLFYPMDFDAVGPTELNAFSDHIDEFHQLNAEVVACTVESHLTHLKWLKTPREEGGIYGLQFPVIADKTTAVTQAYHVFNDEEGMPYRALFIIDVKGVLRHVTINDSSASRSVSETQRLIKLIDEVDKQGEAASLAQIPEAMTTSVRKMRRIICSEKSSLREVLD